MPSQKKIIHNNKIWTIRIAALVFALLSCTSCSFTAIRQFHESISSLATNSSLQTKLSSEADITQAREEYKTDIEIRTSYFNILMRYDEIIEDYSELCDDYHIEGNIHYPVIIPIREEDYENIKRVNSILRYIPYNLVGKVYFPPNNLKMLLFEPDSETLERAKWFYWYGTTDYSIEYVDKSTICVKYNGITIDRQRRYPSVALITIDLQTGEFVKIRSLYDELIVSECIMNGHFDLIDGNYLPGGINANDINTRNEISESFINGINKDADNWIDSDLELFCFNQSMNFNIDEENIYINVNYYDSLNGYIIIKIERKLLDSMANI